MREVTSGRQYNHTTYLKWKVQQLKPILRMGCVVQEGPGMLAALSDDPAIACLVEYNPDADAPLRAEQEAIALLGKRALQQFDLAIEQKSAAAGEHLPGNWRERDAAASATGRPLPDYHIERRRRSTTIEEDHAWLRGLQGKAAAALRQAPTVRLTREELEAAKARAFSEWIGAGEFAHNSL